MTIDEREPAVVAVRPEATRRATPAWLVVAGRESRDLWVGGRGPVLLFAVSVLLSVLTYLLATNRVLNYLEQREAVGLALQVTVAVGVLVTVVVSADAISGERERGTLETLLLTPAPRRQVAAGKLLAALTLWLAIYAVSLPYVWVLARGVSVLGSAVPLGLAVGSMLAAGVAAVGLIVGGLASSNRVSLAASLFLLLALFAPTQLPAGTRQGWLGDVLLRLNPVASGVHYLGAVLVTGHRWTRDLSYLVSPALTAVLAGAVVLVCADRLIRLERGGSVG
ncbi:MAG TPA: ABC transporter permease subunit [Mycobacteriales bacterium]|nr:ABC transporter permease subunit [Mycobacteriales bacterium]